MISRITELLKLLDQPEDACQVTRTRLVRVPAGLVRLHVDVDTTELTEEQLTGLLAVLRAFERLREQP